MPNPVNPSIHPLSPPSPTTDEAPQRKILSVSQLNGDIKRLLENQLGQVWLKGEVSNLRIPSSGHAYFTLKDENAQIGAVLFRGRMQGLRFELGDGMEIVGFGKISVYEPRGNYQIVLEHVEPAGLGLLQAAFEKLKEKLAKEGLFDPARKRPLPYLPRRIGVVTSPTGAAIRDILKVLSRRNPRLCVLLAAAKVQGEGSAREIAERIQDLNEYSERQTDEFLKLDLLIVGRGGGSLEDLWSFNEEIVARAIHGSKIPIISAVGHEIDFTIADFVADMRAPTPSAAAEITTPVLQELVEHVEELYAELRQAMRDGVKERRTQVQSLTDRLRRPDQRLADLRLRVDDWAGRLRQALVHLVSDRTNRVHKSIDLLHRASPLRQVSEARVRIAHLQEGNRRSMEKFLMQLRGRLEVRAEGLHALSPLNILGRGYSVTRDAKSKDVLRNVEKIRLGQAIEVILDQGSLEASVTALHPKEGKHKEGAEKPAAPATPVSGTQRQLWS